MMTACYLVLTSRQVTASIQKLVIKYSFFYSSPARLTIGSDDLSKNNISIDTYVEFDRGYQVCWFGGVSSHLNGVQSKIAFNFG